LTHKTKYVERDEPSHRRKAKFPKKKENKLTVSIAIFKSKFELKKQKTEN